MAGAILYVLDEGFGFAEMLEYRANDIQVGLRSAGGNVVQGAWHRLIESQRDSEAKVLDKEPISLLHAVAINGERFILAGICNHQGNQLFRELEGAEIVCAAQNDCRKAIGISVGSDKMFRGGFAGGIRAARIEQRMFCKSRSSGRASIYLIGADVDEPEPWIMPCRFEEAMSAENIGLEKRGSILDAAVHVSLRSEVNHGVKGVGEEMLNPVPVANVTANKAIPGIFSAVQQVFRVARVG